MPGREKEYEEATKEYEEFRAQGGAEDGSADPTPPRLQFVITQPMLIELLSLGTVITGVRTRGLPAMLLRLACYAAWRAACLAPCCMLGMLGMLGMVIRLLTPRA